MMKTFPNYDQFCQYYDNGKSSLLSLQLAGDLHSALAVLLSLCSDEHHDMMRNSFIFESVVGGEKAARYSIIGTVPDVIWRYKHNKAEINRHAHDADGGKFVDCLDAPLESLKQFIDESQIDIYPDNLPDVAAGIFGYLGYNTIHHIEKIPQNNPDPLDCDDGVYFRPQLVVVFDHAYQHLFFVTPIYVRNDRTALQAYDYACDLLSRFYDRLINKPLSYHDTASSDTQIGDVNQNISSDEYQHIVRQAQQYIKDGDIFQSVLSLRFNMGFKGNNIDLYRMLRRTNPSPYMFFMKLYNDVTIVGSSPEILVKAENSKVTIRPIAGTRARGKNNIEDKKLAEELLADEKELAEHLMLLDLGRNDVGRICDIGSVMVEDSFFIERYSHVMHIVSQVSGNLSDGHHVLDALCAGFPAGTVSGAPKIRAMEIINELEPHQRGIYAGCVGYFTANGNMDNCITLRTAVIKDDMLYVQAGAGVVADSIPLREYQECCAKAKVILEAARQLKNQQTN